MINKVLYPLYECVMTLVKGGKGRRADGREGIELPLSCWEHRHKSDTVPLLGWHGSMGAGRLGGRAAGREGR